MKLRRLRLGELLALIGAIALAVLSFLPWFQGPNGNLSAWDAFGVVTVLIVIVVVSALVLAITTLTERTTALPEASAVWTTFLAIVTTIAIAVWLLVLPGEATGHCAASWLGLAASALILVGAWQSMRDERTRAYPPDDTPRRPAPPA
jgi:hypothetical protein